MSQHNDHKLSRDFTRDSLRLQPFLEAEIASLARGLITPEKDPSVALYPGMDRMLHATIPLAESTDAMSGAGAVPLTSSTTKLTSTGANALTLADGVDQQIKRIVMVVDGGDATLTPATKTGFTTVVFNAVGDAVTLQFHSTLGWMVVSNHNATIA